MPVSTTHINQEENHCYRKLEFTWNKNKTLKTQVSVPSFFVFHYQFHNYSFYVNANIGFISLIVYTSIFSLGLYHRTILVLIGAPFYLGVTMSPMFLKKKFFFFF